MSTLKELQNNVKDTTKSFYDFAKSTFPTAEGLDKLTSKMAGASAISLTLAKSFQMPMKALEAWNGQFDKSFKIIGDYEYKIYKVSNSLRAQAKDYQTLEKAQSEYANRVSSISKQVALLSRSEVSDVLNDLTSSFKGIHDANVSKDFNDIVVSMSNFSGSAEEAKKNVDALRGSLSKYTEAKVLLAAASRGEKGGAAGALALFASGSIDYEAFQKAMGGGKNSIERGATTGQIGGGAQNVQAANKAAMENAQRATAEATANSEFARGIKSTGTMFSQMAEKGAGFLGVLNQLSAAGNLAAGITGFGAATSSGLRMTGGIADFVSKVAGKTAVGKIAGATSGLISSAERSTATRVFVVNLDEIKGGGLLGSGSGTGPGSVTDVLTKGKGGIVGNLLKATGMAAVAYGAGWATTQGYSALEKKMGWNQKGMSDKRKEEHEATTKKWGMGGALGAAAIVAGITLATGGIGLVPALALAVGAGAVGAGGAAATGSYLDRKRFEKGQSPEEVAKAKSAEDFAKFEKLGTAINQMVMDTNLRMETSQVRKDVSGTLIGTYKEGGGFGSELSKAYEMQASAQRAEAALILNEQIPVHNQVIAKIKEEMSTMAEGPTKQAAMNALLKEEAAVEKMRATAIQDTISAAMSELDSKNALEQKSLAMASVETDLTKSTRDLHTAQRMGIGQSYLDQMLTIEATAKEVKHARAIAQTNYQLEKEARARGNEDQALKYHVVAVQSEATANRKEQDLYNESKAAREGYLDAIRASMSATGGYTEMVASADFGTQNIENTLRHGGVVAGGASVKEASRFGPNGLEVGGSPILGPDKLVGRAGAMKDYEKGSLALMPEGPGISPILGAVGLSDPAAAAAAREAYAKGINPFQQGSSGSNNNSIYKPQAGGYGAPQMSASSPQTSSSSATSSPSSNVYESMSMHMKALAADFDKLSHSSTPAVNQPAPNFK